MPIEKNILSWAALPWEDGMSREDLLATRIRLLEQRPEDVKMAIDYIKKSQPKNKEAFYKKHQLCPKKKEEGDWVLVYDGSFDNQHNATRKFLNRWFGPYVLKTVEDNATYQFMELDGTYLVVLIAGKRVKQGTLGENNEVP